MRLFARAGAVCGLLLCAQAPAAAPPIQLDASADRVPLAGLVEMVEVSTDVQLEEVASPAFAARFRPLRAPAENLGYSDAAVWVRFQLQNGGSRTLYPVLEVASTIEFATLYQPAKGGHVEVLATGKAVASVDRPLKSSLLALKLTVEPGPPRTYYLRLASEDTLYVAPILHSADGILKRVTVRNFFFGLLLGILFAVIAYNLAVFVAIRDPVYLWYVLFELCGLVAISAASRVADGVLWPTAERWASRSSAFFGCLMVVPAIGFAWHFLAFPALPRAFRALARAIQGATVLTCVAMLVAWHPALLAVRSVLAMVCGLVLSLAGGFALRYGFRNALYFFVAWTLLLSSMTLNALESFGLGWLQLNWVQNVLTGSVALEAILLSAALSFRLRGIREDERSAREALLQHRAEQAEVLEQRVAQRTSELNQALGSLKQAQVSLVQQARLASLGNLAAGLTHEVGNPLNFSVGGADELSESLERLRQVPTLQGGRGGEELPRMQEALALVRRGHQRISQLLGNLRTYLAGGARAAQPVDVVAELEATASLMASKLRERKFELRCPPAPGPRVLARPGELSQVLMNLLANAADATSPGELIRAEVGSSPEQVEVSVEDLGRGVAPEHRDAIFEPFFTTRPPGQGMGLGLAISQEIARRLGGELSLAEARGSTRFVLRLPRGDVGQAGNSD